MFFQEQSTIILTEQVRERLKRLKGIIHDLELLEAFDAKLQIFGNSTQGLNNQKIVLEAIQGEFREPLQILIKSYRLKYRETYKQPSKFLAGDLKPIGGVAM